MSHYCETGEDLLAGVHVGLSQSSKSSIVFAYPTDQPFHVTELK